MNVNENDVDAPIYIFPSFPFLFSPATSQEYPSTFTLLQVYKPNNFSKFSPMIILFHQNNQRILVPFEQDFRSKVREFLLQSIYFKLKTILIA